MTVLVAVLAATAAALLVRAPARVPRPTEASIDPIDRAPLGVARFRGVLAVTALAGGWALLGGALGIVAGVGAAGTVWVALGRVEHPSAVRHRAELRTDLPVAVDLFAACLAAGAAPETALLSTGHALGGAVAKEFASLHHLLEVGVDPERVWAVAAGHPELGPLGRALHRAQHSGAPVEAVVRRLAAELRERQWADVEARARSIEVRAAAPLGLCLLPAFMLLGVVPMVVAVFSSMRLF